MILRRYGNFVGGIDLPDAKGATIDLPIRPARPVDRLRVSLAPCGRAPARLIVEPGRKVAAGERIAIAGGEGGVDVFAPLAGTVGATATAAVAGDDGFEIAAAVELTDLSETPDMAPPAPVFDWQAADAAALRERIAAGALTTHRRPVMPLAGWIDRARSGRCRTIIINAMESQPYVTADHRVLLEHGIDVIRGLVILARMLEIGELILAADQRRTDDYRPLIGPARLHGVRAIALEHKYPIGADAVLVKVLTRRAVPVGGTTMDVGAAVIDAASCLAVYRWVVCGLRDVGRVVTLAGERMRHCGNFFVPFGTLCLDLAATVDADADSPVIHGGPMVGLRCTPEAVVGPATDAILAPEVAPAAVPGACIRCGWCTSYCPARLNVTALNDLFELGQIDRARRAGAKACMGCGICSYVCPARLPLSQRVKKLKRAIASGRQTTRSQAVS